MVSRADNLKVLGGHLQQFAEGVERVEEAGEERLFPLHYNLAVLIHIADNTHGASNNKKNKFYLIIYFIYKFYLIIYFIYNFF